MVAGWHSLMKKLILLLASMSLLACFFLYFIPAQSPTELYSAGFGWQNTISPNVFDKHLKIHGTKRRLPQTIIIGVRKCGTRALIEMLGLHPSVVKSEPEIHFFDDDVFYANGLDWYRKKMPFSFDSQVTIEKTPSYFISKDAPGRIRAMNESIKLLLIVRDPTTRVLSDYTQISEVRRARGKPITPFEDKVISEDGEINENFMAVQISQYFVYMVRWLRVFPRDQIHIVDGDRLIDKPYDEIKKVESFLDLPTFFTPNNFYYNQTKGFYCLQSDSRRKCLSSTKGRPHATVNPHTISKLRTYFIPFNEHFYELVGQNFSWPSS